MKNGYLIVATFDGVEGEITFFCRQLANGVIKLRRGL